MKYSKKKKKKKKQKTRDYCKGKVKWELYGLYRVGSFGSGFGDGRGQGIASEELGFESISVLSRPGGWEEWEGSLGVVWFGGWVCVGVWVGVKCFE